MAIQTQAKNKTTTLESRLEQKQDLRIELDRLEVLISDLKTQYEQYFSGILQLSPDRLHNQVKQLIRTLMKAPFRNSALNYRLRSIKQRYNTFDTYWQRILKQKEEGTYAKDVFKSQLREKIALEEAEAGTLKGKAEQNMKALFGSYKTALEKSSGRTAKLDFDAFKKSLIARAKDFKDKNPDKKLSFKVVVKEGKVSVQATIKP